MIGRTISHYKILEMLGEGGMGVVYKAEDLTLNRPVALKFLPDGDGTGEARDRLLSEARSASVLNHPNICTIHEIGEADGRTFIVMEFIAGKSLRKAIEAGPIPLSAVLRIAIGVAEGLQAAHERGIVHRDIKPENIILTADGSAKIADFGLAIPVERPHADNAATSGGTIGYMSPEQVSGSHADHRSDLWSFGVVLYEMATGSRPFWGEYEQATMYSIVHDKHRPASALRGDIPPDLGKIIDRCLEKTSAARIQDAGALLAELRRVTPEPAAPRTAPALSIAVLPFADLSPAQDNKYFSDGLTEEIIASLSRLQNVKIISRSSVMRYEREGKTTKQIASDLGVQYLLEGSVRKRGSDLRITTHLVDTNQDAYLWAENYSGTMEQIFDFQERVASRIVKALKMKLTPTERKTLKRRATENTEAFQLYLKGRFFWAQRREDALKTAIRYFEEAIGKDGGYAAAWAGIADSYNLLSEYENVPRKESYPKARAAANTAVKLDAGLAEAHTSLGLLIMLNELDWKNSGKEFRLAISLNPNYPTAHHWYSEWLMYQGQIAESILEISKAEELEPLSPAILKDKGMTLYYARDYDGALAYGRKSLELDPKFGSAHRLLSMAYQGKKMFPEAIDENERWSETTGNGDLTLIALAQCHAAAGNSAEALKLLASVGPEASANGNLLRGIGLVYAALGENDLAFSTLGSAFELKAEAICSLKVDPKVDRIRSDPRFDLLLKKVGLEP